MSYSRYGKSSNGMGTSVTKSYERYSSTGIHSAVYGANQNHITRENPLPSYQKKTTPTYNKSNLTSSSSTLVPKLSSPSKTNPTKSTSFQKSSATATGSDAAVRPSARRDSFDVVRPATRYRAPSHSTAALTRERPINGTLYSRSLSQSPSGGGTAVKATGVKSDVPGAARSSSLLRRSGSNADLLNGAYSKSSSVIGSTTSAVLTSHRHDKDENSRHVTSYQPSFLDNSRKTPDRASSNGSSRHNSDRYEGGGTAGLVNIGNTCFMNSILQCLSNTRQLKDYCLSSRYVDDLNPSSSMKGNLMNGFIDVIKQLWDPDQSAVTPQNFKKQIQKFSPRFTGYEQQDSQEFLRFLLEGLHEEINKVKRKSSKLVPEMSGLNAREKAERTWEWYKGKDDSFIFDLFVGQLESSLQCHQCKHVSLTFDPFWDLSLPVAKKMYGSSETSVDDCLQNFTKEEVLDDDEKPMCDKCKVRRRMTKRLSVHKFPTILVLHLKRFSEGSRFRQKLGSMVKFPLRSLDLTPYASDHYEAEVASPVYDLYAVSNHMGSCYGGHYTAYCCNPHSKQWNNFNDSSVKPMSESSVCTKEAYVLFYQLRRRGSSRL